MLKEVLNSCEHVVNNSKHVKINYKNADKLIPELINFNNVHYLVKLPCDILNMNTKDIVNLLLIYDSINFSFWGNPKWTINNDGKELDGSIALFHCIYNLFKDNKSEEIYSKLESMTLKEFEYILKGNIEIPLLKERYKIVNDIATIVNKKMNGNFYERIKNMKSDNEIFEFILENFKSFEDKRKYKNKTVYFYKLAQLLTSDIIHIIKIKENVSIDCSNLIGCADYKIPQVMESLNILEYDNELLTFITDKNEIKENSEFEVEIRASMIIVIDYIYNKINRSINRIDINDFIWSKGQDKSRKSKPYHLTRTTSY